MLKNNNEGASNFLFGEGKNNDDNKDEFLFKKNDTSILKYFKNSKDKVTEALYNYLIFKNIENKEEENSQLEEKKVISKECQQSDQLEEENKVLPTTENHEEKISKTEKKLSPCMIENTPSKEEIKKMNNDQNLNDSIYSTPQNLKTNTPSKYSLEKQKNGFGINRNLKKIKHKTLEDRFLKNLFKTIIIIFLILFANDLHSKYVESNENLQAKIMSWKSVNNYLIKEYSLNNCDKISLDDSPLIFEFCQKKREEIENSKIYLIPLLIEFTTDNINTFSFNITFRSIILIILVIVIFYKVIIHK